MIVERSGMLIDSSGMLIDSSVWFALGLSVPRFVSDLADNPKRRERKQARLPRCNRWHTENASTASSESSRISWDEHLRKVLESQCLNKGSLENTVLHRFLAPHRRSIHQRDRASRCQRSECSRDPLFDLFFRGIPVGETNFSGCGKP